MPLVKKGEGVEVSPGVFVHWLEDQPIPYAHQILRNQISALPVGAALAFVGLLVWGVWTLSVAAEVWVIAAVLLGLGVFQESKKVDLYDKVLDQFSEETLKAAISSGKIPLGTAACVLRNIQRRFPAPPEITPDDH